MSKESCLHTMSNNNGARECSLIRFELCLCFRVQDIDKHRRKFGKVVAKHLKTYKDLHFWLKLFMQIGDFSFRFWYSFKTVRDKTTPNCKLLCAVCQLFIS